jgi:hypothetical protein
MNTKERPFAECEKHMTLAGKYYAKNYRVKEDLIKHGYIYVIQAHKFVKIGFSSEDRLEQRLQSIQSSCPLKIKLIYKDMANLEAETAIHKAFKEFSVQGEWYEYKGIIKELIGFAESFGFINLLEGYHGTSQLRVRKEYTMAIRNEYLRKKEARKLAKQGLQHHCNALA